MRPQRRPLLLTLLALACAPRVVAPVDFGLQGRADSAEELLARIELVERSVDRLQGEARLLVEDPRGKASFGLFAAVRAPAAMHLEVLDFFGKPQGVLVTDGAELGVYDATSATYFRGPATAPNMGRLVPLAVPPAELAALLLGRAPRLPARALELGFDEERGLYRLVLRNGPVSQVLLVQPGTHRVTSSTVEGLEAYSVTMTDMQPAGPTQLPRRLRLVASSPPATVELHYTQLQAGGALDEALFARTPPESATLVEVDAQGRPR